MSRRLDKPDTPADIELKECLSAAERRSFVMVAGAGSGKTTSLIKALSAIIDVHFASLKCRRQRVACITYTEIAAQEVWADVGNNPLVHVSTIHSFMWTLVRPFQSDIRNWVASRIQEKIGELEGKTYGPRVHQRTKEKDQRDLARFRQSLRRIDRVRSFAYGTGSDYTKGILGHDDVLRCATQFLNQRPLFRTLLAQQFPFVFVDESQDTSEGLVAGLKAVASQSQGKFCVGFFGDPMQRIYMTGVGPIRAEDGWATITKQENFRCPTAVLSVANAIRRGDDGLVQTRGRTITTAEGEEISVEGTARMFILPADEQRDQNIAKVRAWVGEQNKDQAWRDGAIKLLVIVHRMAARRLGFDDLYVVMNSNAPSSFKDGFLDATAWPLRPIMSLALPLASATVEGREFEAMSLLRKFSPKLAKENIPRVGISALLAGLRQAAAKLAELMQPDSRATTREVLEHMRDTGLITLDPRILSYLEAVAPPPPDQHDDQAAQDEGEDNRLEMSAMDGFLASKASGFIGYKEYVDELSPFSTQQGIKGAEFDRVLVIADDGESSHSQFSYDKYFGVKELSLNDKKSLEEGRETQIERTRRLFYVCCTRAMKDLVVILFSDDVGAAERSVRAMNLFPADMIFTRTEFS
ncbi:UvrD-helicase domain-containing protein [Luteimonas sp. 3794]|uniref:UvrD-helicase domain-containing protein n=1 Tax=Luteimonas sp. 3794 TaxID=2817730 RepID=UPI0028679DBC|nr:UvrD-helicase domain-containing protein [Luteimonas sp. 3794]MDR6990297.1 DNA helicase-2/ATP-dependent DNA helicase PcrA [Luteimonas sp. 3794]